MQNLHDLHGSVVPLVGARKRTLGSLPHGNWLPEHTRSRKLDAQFSSREAIAMYSVGERNDDPI